MTGSSIQSAMETTTPAGPITLRNRPVGRCAIRPDADLAAKIGMPAILYFQLLPDMGRMNG
jgi:hypothetical protein